MAQVRYKFWLFECFRAKPYWVIPDCHEGEFRPKSGVVNSKGFIDCQACDNVKCPDFVIPDCLEDAYETIAKMEDWNNKGLGYLGSGKIGVVQGKTYDEIVDCYNFMNKYR